MGVHRWILTEVEIGPLPEQEVIVGYRTERDQFVQAGIKAVLKPILNDASK